ncbi:hypothetical protein FACS189472_18470 [Alphaproteobacteria bacterium]|nr:hypothetical protein FACS189472_18470 [Alphaproteobacteria bacterium]
MIEEEFAQAHTEVQKLMMWVEQEVQRYSGLKELKKVEQEKKIG